MGLLLPILSGQSEKDTLKNTITVTYRISETRNSINSHISKNVSHKSLLFTDGEISQYGSKNSDFGVILLHKSSQKSEKSSDY